jgi:hypothetical protein
MKDTMRNRGLIFAVTITLTAVLTLFGSVEHANGAPTEGLLQKGRVTGFPIPRFVSLDATQARLRAGPGTQYRIKWLYTRGGIRHWCRDQISTLCVYAAGIENSLIGPACRTNITPPAAITSIR